VQYHCCCSKDKTRHPQPPYHHACFQHNNIVTQLNHSTWNCDWSANGILKLEWHLHVYILSSMSWFSLSISLFLGPFPQGNIIKIIMYPCLSHSTPWLVHWVDHTRRLTLITINRTSCLGSLEQFAFNLLILLQVLNFFNCLSIQSIELGVSALIMSAYNIVAFIIMERCKTQILIIIFVSVFYLAFPVIVWFNKPLSPPLCLKEVDHNVTNQLVIPDSMFTFFWCARYYFINSVSILISSGCCSRGTPSKNNGPWPVAFRTAA